MWGLDFPHVAANTGGVNLEELGGKMITIFAFLCSLFCIFERAVKQVERDDVPSSVLTAS